VSVTVLVGRVMVWLGPAETTGGWLPPEAGLTVMVTSLLELSWLSLAVKRRT
jgi:hypothetical protein